MGVPGRRLDWLPLKRSVRTGESSAATTPDDPLESKNNRAALRNHWRDSATRPGSYNDFNRLALLAFRRLLGLALFRRGFFLRFCFHLFLGHRLFLGLLSRRGRLSGCGRRGGFVVLAVFFRFFVDHHFIHFFHDIHVRVLRAFLVVVRFKVGQLVVFVVVHFCVEH